MILCHSQQTGCMLRVAQSGQSCQNGMYQPAACHLWEMIQSLSHSRLLLSPRKIPESAPKGEDLGIVQMVNLKGVYFLIKIKSHLS